MARVIAFAHAPRALRYLDGLRAALVCGCALALIVAGRAFPAFG